MTTVAATAAPAVQIRARRHWRNGSAAGATRRRVTLDLIAIELVLAGERPATILNAAEKREAIRQALELGRPYSWLESHLHAGSQTIALALDEPIQLIPA